MSTVGKVNKKMQNDLYPSMEDNDVNNFMTKAWKGFSITVRILYETPAEAAGFAIMGLVMQALKPSLVAPFIGICSSLVLSRLVVKVLDQYNIQSLVKIKKEICKLNNNYPKLQMIAFIFALAISLLTPVLGFLVGSAVGTVGAIVLDVENNKILQNKNRRNR